MLIEEGTIFRKSNVIFKETNLIDTRMNKHPLLIPIEVEFEDEYIYFFTISSQVQHYTQDKKRYYLIKRRKGSGIKRTSIIDLKHVYKCERETYMPEGYLDPGQVDEILEKFKSYPGLNMDNDCQELLSKIS